MDVYEALYTTRAMRRVKPDPIPIDVQQRIIDAAIRAPSGGNQQNWRFLLVDDPAVKAKLGPLYRECLAILWSTIYRGMVARAEAEPEHPESAQFRTMQSSAQHLADHFEGYPLLMFGFAKGDASGGSIYPAVWSAQLAARAEGIGSSLTSVLFMRRDEVFEVLGLPKDSDWVMACMITLGYPTGRWGVAPRRPSHEVTNRNQWDQPAGFETPDPLWSAEGAQR